MPAQTLDILIAIDARLAGLEATQKQLKLAATEARKLEADGRNAASALETGFAVTLTDKLVSGLQSAGRALAQFIADGVEFNATIESSTLGIAAIIKQFDTAGRFTNFNAAIGESTKAIELLKKKAVESPATFEQLVTGFQGLTGVFTAGGIKLRQQVDLVVLMSQALAGLGLRSDQLLQEGRALVTGDIDQNALVARTLQITKAEIDGAKEKGRLFDFLAGKLAVFGEAGKLAQGSLNTELSNVGDALTQLKGIATTEVFKEVRSDLAALISLLGDPKAQQFAAGVGGALAGVISRTKEIVALFESLVGKNYFSTAFGEVFPKSAAEFRTGSLNAQASQNIKIQDSLSDQVASAQTLQDKEKARAAILDEIQKTTELITSDDKDVVFLADAHIKILGKLLTGFDALAGTKKQIAETDTQAAEKAKNDQAIIERTIGSQLALARANLSNDAQLVTKLTEQQYVEEIIAKLVKEAGAERGKSVEFVRAATAAARELAGLEKQIADQKSRAATAENLRAARDAGKTGSALIPSLREKAEKARVTSSLARSDLGIDAPGESDLPGERNFQPGRGDLYGGIEVPKQAETLSQFKKEAAQSAAELSRAEADAKSKLQASTTRVSSLDRQIEVVQFQVESARRARDEEIATARRDAPPGAPEDSLAAADSTEFLRQREEALADLLQKKNAASTEFSSIQTKIASNEKDILQTTTDEQERGVKITEGVAKLKTLKEQLALTDEDVLKIATKQVDQEEAKQAALKKQREELEKERDILRDNDRQISSVRGNPFLTTEEKQSALTPLLAQQREALQKKPGENAGALDKNRIDTKLNSFGGKLESDFTAFTNSLGTAAENTSQIITGSLGSAIDGVSGSLTALITGTGNWQQVANSAINSIVSDFVRLGVQTVAHYALAGAAQIGFFTTGETLKKAGTVSTIAKQTEEAAVTAPNALLQSIATYGVAAAVGAAAFAAAIALTGGFAEGGYTGAGGKFQPAGIVHRGEFVFDQASVQRIGLGNLEALRVKVRKGYSDGGIVDATALADSAGTARSGSRGNVIVVMNERDLRRTLLEHPDVDNHIVRVGRQRGAEMGRRG